jgi:hypothetical protein
VNPGTVVAGLSTDTGERRRNDQLEDELSRLEDRLGELLGNVDVEIDRAIAERALALADRFVAEVLATGRRDIEVGLRRAGALGSARVEGARREVVAELESWLEEFADDVTRIGAESSMSRSVAVLVADVADVADDAVVPGVIGVFDETDGPKAGDAHPKPSPQFPPESFGVDGRADRRSLLWSVVVPLLLAIPVLAVSLALVG